MLTVPSASACEGLRDGPKGTVTQIEGRVIKINQCVDPPGEARQDWRIVQDIAAALGRIFFHA